MKKNNSKIAELTRELMKNGDISDLTDLQSMMKEMLKQGTETLLEAELDKVHISHLFEHLVRRT